MAARGGRAQLQLGIRPDVCALLLLLHSEPKLRVERAHATHLYAKRRHRGAIGRGVGPHEYAGLIF